MQTANRVAVGSGTLAREDARKVTEAWTQTAQPATAPRQTLRETLTVMAKSGVGVRLVPKKPKATDGH